jgi:ribosome-associated protein
VIDITHRIALDEKELTFSFIRASGPGGQAVNKLSTAVQLRFDVRASPSIPEHVKPKLEVLAGKRLTLDGVIVITAQRHRTQERNREDAVARLVDLIREAATPIIQRRPTKPTKGSQTRRLEGKAKRSGIKSMRGKPARED